MIASGSPCGPHFFKGSFMPSLVNKLVLAICMLSTSRGRSILSDVHAVSNPMANENEVSMKNSAGLDCFFPIGAILAFIRATINWFTGVYDFPASHKTL